MINKILSSLLVVWAISWFAVVTGILVVQPENSPTKTPLWFKIFSSVGFILFLIWIGESCLRNIWNGSYL